MLSVFKNFEILRIPLLWSLLGFAFGLQHYLGYFLNGHSCNFLGTTFGQMPNFLVWAIVSVMTSRFEKSTAIVSDGLSKSDVAFLKKLSVVFVFHLVLLFFIHWVTYGGSYQTTIIGYQDKYPFGWFYFQIIIYALIVSFYSPTLRKRIRQWLISLNGTKYLRYLEVADRQEKKKIDPLELESINANDYYAELRGLDKKYLIRKSLNELEGNLNPDHFLRIHRCTLINVSKVKQVFFRKSQWFVRTHSEAEYPIGRSRKEDVLNHLKKMDIKTS